ncbi:MAG TPA: hypothetical protein VGM63_18025 [Mucilaginibacter sp.]
MGALLTDITLQAGLNYNKVVRPRVQRILLNYPNAYTVKLFNEIICFEGIENVINWHHYIKLDRLNRLIAFSTENQINTCTDFKIFLLKNKNREKYLAVNGIGPKTLDYSLKLLNFDTVAVDRHIYSFVELANVQTKGYDLTKKIVEYAADFLQISRSSMDYSIWRYMSDKEYNKPVLESQLKLHFIDIN